MPRFGSCVVGLMVMLCVQVEAMSCPLVKDIPNDFYPGSKLLCYSDLNCVNKIQMRDANDANHLIKMSKMVSQQGFGHDDILPMVLLYLRKGVDGCVQDDEGNTFLHYLATTRRGGLTGRCIRDWWPSYSCDVHPSVLGLENYDGVTPYQLITLTCELSRVSKKLDPHDH